MTKLKNTKDVAQGLLSFSGALDSDPMTLNGDVMRLFVFYCADIDKNTKAKVKVKILELDQNFIRDKKKVDESSSNDAIGEFDGFLENRDGKFIFSEMKPAKEIDWLKTAPYPYFRIAFAGDEHRVANKSDNATASPTFHVVVGKTDEPQASPEYEIGFMIEKDDGTFLGGSGPAVSYLYGRHSYRPILNLFDIRTKLDSVNLLNITHAQMQRVDPVIGPEAIPMQAAAASSTAVYAASITAYNEKKMKGIDAALKEIEKLIKTSNNPYFQNIQAVNDYYATLDQYKAATEEYKKMQTKDGPGTLNTMVQEKILPLAKKLGTLEDEVHQYLQSSDAPPKEYIDRINRNIAIIARNKNIQEFLDNPAIQIMGLLPGAGVVTGALKLLQGNYFDGLLDVFGSITTYGSFLKLSRVARSFRTASKDTVELLYSYRYREVVSEITGAELMNQITATSLTKCSGFLGELFETIDGFKSLGGYVDSIAILHKNRDYILKMTKGAYEGIKNGLIAKEDGFISFLNSLRDANATAEFFAHLRLLQATAKSGKDAYSVITEAMEEVDKLLGHEDVPGVNDFDQEITENISKLFNFMRPRHFDIKEIIDQTTKSFSSNSEIIEHFNKDLTHFDKMFHLVNLNADVRYQNTRDEMLLALAEIRDTWEAEKHKRDNWIETNKSSYIHESLRELQIQWAHQKPLAATLSESLETRIENFLGKIKGQIALKEALGEKPMLSFLSAEVKQGMVPDGKIIFDMNVDSFRTDAEILIDKYYQQE